MPNVINFYSRRPVYGFLSNYHRCPLFFISGEFGRVEYPTAEHAYQCMKATTQEDHDFILGAASPRQAKNAGGSLKNIKHSWDEKRVSFMRDILTAKFRDSHLQIRLLRTGDAELHEDSPTDMFWGKKGKDVLGRLLVRVRKHYRDFNEEIGIKEDSICAICGDEDAEGMIMGLCLCKKHNYVDYVIGDVTL